MNARLQVVHEEHDDALHLPWLVRLQTSGDRWVEGAGVSWAAAALDAVNVLREWGEGTPHDLRQMEQRLLAIARERTRTQTQNEQEAQSDASTAALV